MNNNKKQFFDNLKKFASLKDVPRKSYILDDSRKTLFMETWNEKPKANWIPNVEIQQEVIWGYNYLTQYNYTG